MLFRAQHWPAIAHDPDIRAGAADVERHQIGGFPAGVARDLGSAADPGGRTGQQGNDRAVAQATREFGAAI